MSQTQSQGTYPEKNRKQGISMMQSADHEETEQQWDGTGLEESGRRTRDLRKISRGVSIRPPQLRVINPIKEARPSVTNSGHFTLK